MLPRSTAVAEVSTRHALGLGRDGRGGDTTRHKTTRPLSLTAPIHVRREEEAEEEGEEDEEEKEEEG